MLDRHRLEQIRTGRTRPDNLASIVIPHYRTPDLVRLCLRAIRRMTDHPFEVIVVDNHSADASIEYLRRVGWIRLIERGPAAEPDAVEAHAAAMDKGTREARGRWLVSLHTDTVVRREGWLGDFVRRLEADPLAAALGAGKIESDPAWYRSMKTFGSLDRMRAAVRGLLGRGASAQQIAAWYPRTYCAVYDLERVRSLGLSFAAEPGQAAGEALYRNLCRAGGAAVRLPDAEMQTYVEHVGHATALLGRGGLRHWRGNHKVRARLRRLLAGDLARELLADDALDA